MGEESLVARLRAKAEALHAEAVRCNFQSHSEEYLYREAADALERAEKERKEHRRVADDLGRHRDYYRAYKVSEDAYQRIVTTILASPQAEVVERLSARIVGLEQELDAAKRALSPSTKDETK